MEMSQQLKRSSEDADHEDGRRAAPRTPRIRACKLHNVLQRRTINLKQVQNAKGIKSNVSP